MKLFLPIAFTILLVSCSGNDEVPKGILPRQKMQEVLWDMLRGGEFLDAFVFRDTTTDKARKAMDWYERIYKLHDITAADFQKSYAYYKQHPALMKEVLDSLSKKRLDDPVVDSTAIKPDSAIAIPPGSVEEAIHDSVLVKDSSSINRFDSIVSKRRTILGRDKFRMMDSLKKARRLPK